MRRPVLRATRRCVCGRQGGLAAVPGVAASRHSRGGAYNPFLRAGSASFPAAIDNQQGARPMAEITAAAVKALRDQTDMPMMMCKQALQEAGGDENRAMEILKEKAGKRLEKRTENVTDEGRIFVQISDDGSRAAMVEVQCESAPVASGEHLGKFGQALVGQLLTGPGAASAAELLAQPAPAGGSLKDLYESLSSKIQEKIVVNRVARAAGPLGVYVHHDGKAAALFEAEGQGKNSEVLRDVAMHIVAMKPAVTQIDQLDPSIVKTERDRLAAEAKATGKPENVIEKIVDGRMKTFYREDAGVLVEQAFAKDPAKSVGQALQEAGYKAKNFTLWRLGK
jgi:elongation factor Ts